MKETDSREKSAVESILTQFLPRPFTSNAHFQAVKKMKNKNYTDCNAATIFSILTSFLHFYF